VSRHLRYLWRPASAATITVLFAIAWIRLGPLPKDLLESAHVASTIVVDRHGAVLYEARAGDGTRGSALAANALPPTLVSATLAAEDHRFRRHVGIDPIALARASWRNARALRVVEGGSTITQQVAGLLIARQRHSVQRGLRAKIREAVIALRLEHRLTKDEILALYLNLAPYGNQFVGAERASRAYFGCPAPRLTPAQAAFLASLPQRPSGFNPYRKADSAVARQRRVLRRMAALGWLRAADARDARAERLHVNREPAAFAAPHFVEMVLASHRDKRIETTLDLDLQREVTGIIGSHRRLLDRHGAHNVAVVVLDNARGQWLAWEGSGDYFDERHGGTIDGALALRQPGSALKPFTYALAFELGQTPTSVLPDIPAHFPTAEPGIVYSPRNYDGRYRGPLTARRALAGSENVPAVALASDIGVPTLIRFLRRAGMTTFDRTAAHYGLGVTLGNAEVRLADLVAGYATFARGGVWIEPVTRLARADLQARPGGRLVSPRTAFWITDILSDGTAREYIFGRGGSLEFPFQVAVKTGTSQAYRDNWAIGYTREVTVGVWVGNFDRSPLRDSSGVTGAGPIFHAVMLAAARRSKGRLPEAADPPIVEPPASVTRGAICALSGMGAEPWCPAHLTEWLPADRPAKPCAWHRLSRDGQVALDLPPEYRQWAAKEMGTVPISQNEARVSHSAKWGQSPFAITNPPAGAIYLIDPTLRAEFQTLPLRARAVEPRVYVEWAIDERVVGTAPADAALEWPLAPGRHRVRARDASGRTAETEILVK